MLKRRSFLAMLGLSPAMPALAATAPVEAAMPVVEAAAEGVVMANVSMPVKVSLTKEQVEMAESMGMPVWEYAKNLMALKREGKIEAPVHISADVQASPVPTESRVAGWDAKVEYVSKEHAAINPDLDRFWSQN